MATMTSTDKALVRLYYENFGYGAEEIGSLLAQSPVVIKALITENQLMAPDNAAELKKKNELLLEYDLDKQMALAPFYARAEIMVLHKAHEILDSLSAEDQDAPNRITACARAIKDIRSASLSAKLDDAASGSKITVQIMDTL